MHRKRVFWSTTVIAIVAVTVFVCWNSDTGKLGTQVCAPLPNSYLHAVSPEDWLYEASEEEGRYGWIDQNGNWIVQPRFDRVQVLVKTRAGVAYHGGVAFVVSRDGSQIALTALGGGQIEELGCFADGLAPVKIDGKWGYVGVEGHVAIPCFYDAASQFRGGVARVGRRVRRLIEYVADVGTHYEYSFIDVEGTPVAASDARVHRFLSRDSKLLSRELGTSSDSWGFVDSEGVFVIAPSFQVAKRFSKGLAPVKMHDGYHYIDPKGAVALRGPFDNADPFSEGLAGVQIEGMWGYVDPSGDLVIAPQFLFAGEFQGPLARVVLPGRTAYIDRSGNVVWPAD